MKTFQHDILRCHCNSNWFSDCLRRKVCEEKYTSFHSGDLLILSVETCPKCTAYYWRLDTK
jgi:hypothetical protein